MRTISKFAVIIVALFNCSFANAQTYTSVQWGIDRTSTPSPVCIMSGSSCIGQIGLVNIVNGVWKTIYNSGSPISTYTNSILFNNPTNPLVVNSSQYDLMRISQPNGTNNKYLLTGTSPLVAGLNFQMESDAASSASSNMYGVIGKVLNNGVGTTKAIYGRAIANTGATGPVIAGVFGTECSTGNSNCYGIQMSHDTYTRGGTLAAGIWQTSNIVGQKAQINYGFLLDGSVEIQNSGLQMAGGGPGEFLTLQNSTQTQNLFTVDKNGRIYTVNEIVALGNVTATTNLITGTPGNGITMDLASIRRNAAAGSLTIAAGTNPGNTISIQTGGSGRVDINDSEVTVGNMKSNIYYSQGALPSVSSCGTGAAVVAFSSTNYGRISMGTGTPSTCTVTFAQSFPNQAFCTITMHSNYVDTYYISSETASGFTLQLHSGSDGVVFNYNCGGK